jgi:hypothetical protein
MQAAKHITSLQDVRVAGSRSRLQRLRLTGFLDIRALLESKARLEEIFALCPINPIDFEKHRFRSGI